MLKNNCNIIDTVKDAARAITPDGIWARLRAYDKPLNLYETNRFNFFPVSHDPLVIYTFTGWSLGNVFHMSQSLDGRPASFIVGFTKYPSDWKLIYLHRQLREYFDKYPDNRVVFIVNSRDELRSMRKFGFDCRFVNKNAFQREDQFIVKPSTEKKYNAVMNARTIRVKRMELARKIGSMAIITVVSNEEYYAEMRDVLAKAEWVNFDGQGNYTYLSRSEVCRVLNQSQTGLTLSALEGNNKASIEYLLSGIPVVSTPSKGGRDVFFEEDFCAIVEPTPEAVRQGVDAMIARNIDPWSIRERTLSKIRDHRARFLSLVSDLSDGVYDASIDDWLDLFPRNMKFRCQPKHFRSFLESGYLTECPEFTSESTLREKRPSFWRSIVNSVTSENSNG